MSFLAQKNAPSLDTKIANLDGDVISTNQESIPVPYHTGDAPQAVKWISKAFNVVVEDINAQTGKKSQSTVARNYYADLAGVVCHGVVTKLWKIIINQNVVWTGALTPDTTGTGVDYKDVAIEGWGTMRIYWGTETQSPCPWLTAAVPNPAYTSEYDEGSGTYTDNGEPATLPGMSHPAYLGICYVVFQKLLFGRDTTNAPTVVLEVERLGDCPILSSIPTFTRQCDIDVGNRNIGMSTQTSSELAGIGVGMTVTGTGIPAGTVVEAVIDDGPGAIYFHISKDPTATAYNTTVTFGQATNDKTQEGVSPLIPAYELLVNRRFGFGQDPAEIIDTPSWQATAAAIKPGAADFVNRMSTNVSCQLTKPTEIKQLFAELTSYYDGWFRLNQGKVEAGYYPHRAPADESAILLLDVQDMAQGREPDITFRGWSDTTNQVYLTGRDRDRQFKDSPQPYQSLYNLKITKENRPVNLSKPWCITAANAKLLAADIGKIEAVPYASGNLYCRAERVEDLNPGDVFRLNYEPLQLNFLCRCTQITRPDPKGGIATVAFVQERGVVPQPYQLAPDDTPAPPQLTATPAGMAKVFELYKEFTDSEDTKCAVLVARPHQSSRGYITQFARVQPNYENLSDHEFFAKHVRLDVAYAIGDAGAMTVTVGGIDTSAIESQSDDLRDDDNLLLFMNGEMFSIGAVTPLGSNQYQIAVLRSRGGTPKQTHARYSQGFIIERSKLNVVTSKAFTSATTGYFNILPYTARDQVADADGLVVSVNFRDRGLDKPVITWDAATSVSANVGDVLKFTGTVTDQNKDLIQVTVVAQLISGGVAVKEVVGLSTIIDPTDSYAFKASFTFWEAGTYRILCRAMDSRQNTDGYAEKYYPNNGAPTNVTINGATLGGVLVQLNGVNKTYYQGTAPSGSLIAGDLWFDISNGYKLYRWSGSAWISVTRVVDASDFGNGVAPVGYGSSLPNPTGYTGPKTFFLTTNSKLYRYNGSGWTVAVPAGDIINQLTAGQIAAGAISATHVGTNLLIANSANIADAVITSAKIVSIDAGLINAGTIDVALTLSAANITGGTIVIGSGINKVSINTSGAVFGDPTGSSYNMWFTNQPGYGDALYFRSGTTIKGWIARGLYSGIDIDIGFGDLNEVGTVNGQKLRAFSSADTRTTDTALCVAGGVYISGTTDFYGDVYLNSGKTLTTPKIVVTDGGSITALGVQFSNASNRIYEYYGINLLGQGSKWPVRVRGSALLVGIDGHGSNFTPGRIYIGDSGCYLEYSSGSLYLTDPNGGTRAL